MTRGVLRENPRSLADFYKKNFRKPKVTIHSVQNRKGKLAGVPYPISGGWGVVVSNITGNIKLLTMLSNTNKLLVMVKASQCL